MGTRALVTGLGCITAAGHNVPEYWENLLKGHSGLIAIREFATDGLRNQHAGEVVLELRQRKQLARLRGHDRWMLLAEIAAREALQDAGFGETPAMGWGGRRVALVVGVSLGMSLTGSQASLGEPSDTEDFSRLAEDLADSLRIDGPACLITTACASGTHAIGIAKDMIEHEGYDVVLCGGVDTLDRAKYLGHSALNTLSTGRLSPFSRHRSGTLFGEGAGMLILQPDPPTGRRSERQVVCSGAGFSCDALHLTAPDDSGNGALRVMRAAISDANLRPEDVGYINLHGSGTTANDAMEWTAIREIFGAHSERVLASSTKANTGHAMGAAGALEAIATVLALRHEVVPPTSGIEASELAFPLQVVCGAPRKASLEHALSNSFGFGGSNGAVLFSAVNS